MNASDCLPCDLLCMCQNARLLLLYGITAFIISGLTSSDIHDLCITLQVVMGTAHYPGKKEKPSMKVYLTWHFVRQIFLSFQMLRFLMIGLVEASVVSYILVGDEVSVGGILFNAMGMTFILDADNLLLSGIPLRISRRYVQIPFSLRAKTADRIDAAKRFFLLFSMATLFSFPLGPMFPTVDMYNQFVVFTWLLAGVSCEMWFVIHLSESRSKIRRMASSLLLRLVVVGLVVYFGIMRMLYFIQGDAGIFDLKIRPKM